jgi:hypothetical protein
MEQNQLARLRKLPCRRSVSTLGSVIFECHGVIQAGGPVLRQTPAELQHRCFGRWRIDLQYAKPTELLMQIVSQTLAYAGQPPVIRAGQRPAALATIMVCIYHEPSRMTAH